MKPTRAYWLCQATGWGVYAVFTIVQLATEVPLARNAGETLFAAALGFGLTHAFRGLALRRRWLAHDFGGLAGRVLGAAFAIAFVHVAILCAVESGLFGDPLSATGLVGAWIRWAEVFLIWTAAWFTHGLVGEVRAREQMLQQAELSALKAQLNPHFLFNALNAIRALVADEPAAAQDAVTRMSRILRYTLGAKEDLVDLAAELAVVDDYLAIEALRLGDRLVVERELAATGRIPPMLLQGLVENAIKHGIARRVDGGTVTVASAATPEGLVLTVTNPLPAQRAPTVDGTGLANMRERLRLLGGPSAKLDLDLAGGLATARVTIPQ